MISLAILDRDILKWLEEDLPYWDVSFIPEQDRDVSGYIMSKAVGILAGTRVATRVLELSNIRVLTARDDGDFVEFGDKIITFEGKASDILIAERVTLNILTHMSAIATKTHSFVKKISESGFHSKIAATRKTLPGLRKYQKWAVIVGGGDSHRLDLSSMALIKENHIATYNGIKNSIDAIRSQISFSYKVEIEVRNPQEALEAARSKVDIILLDNFDPDSLEEIIPQIKAIDPHILIEASGGITEENYLIYAEKGADIISMGSLTHSVKVFDMSLLLNEVII